MEEQVYQGLCQKLAKQGGRHPAMDIPEFYNLIKELFTPVIAWFLSSYPSTV